MIVFSQGTTQTVFAKVIQGFPTPAADVWNKSSPHIIFQLSNLDNYNEIQSKYI